MNPKQDGKFQKFEDDSMGSDFGDKQITLNAGPQNDHQVSSEQHKKEQPKFLKKMIDKKEDVAAGMIVRNNSNASEEMSEAVMSKINTKLQFIGKYFDVEVEDIQAKLISSVIPMNKNFHVLAEKTPDLYGPFWIYTTLVFLITFTGNLSNYISATPENRERFTYNFNFIPNAAFFIYGMGFGVPFVLYLLMKFMFKVDISLVLNICVYGYSFTVLAPILILCIIPFSLLETIFLLYFLGSSCFFLIYNMANLLVEKAKASKYIIFGILLGCQAIFFLVLKFYFFATFSRS